MDASFSQVEPHDPAEERAQRHARMLKEMGEIGMELLREVRDRALTPPCATPEEVRLAPADAGLAYSRLTRAVRLTIALENRFAEEQAARERDPERERARREARRAAEEVARPPARRRRDVLDIMTQKMIRAHAEREDLADEEALYGEAESLIENELSDEDLLERPIPQLIGIICEALDIEPDWSLWDPARWAGEKWGLTEAELAAARPKPPRLVLPPLERAANDAAEGQPVAVHPPP